MAHDAAASALDRSIDRKVKIVLGLRKQFSDDNLAVDAGRDEDNDREMQEIASSLEPDSSSDDWETPEPPEHQKSRNKPGMSVKTKSRSPKTGSEPGMHQAATNSPSGGGNSSETAAA